VALGRGDRRTVAALGELDYVAVEESELDGVAPLENFRNINTRAAFDAAQDRLDAE
jgi:molybdopterin-guanine dinucleotide biosynthesis protein A